MGRPKLRLRFSDFWPGFEPASWPPIRALVSEFDVEITPRATILICGPYRHNHVRHVGTKVFWTHEPHDYDHSEYDFTVGFDVSKRPTHLRFPSFASHLIGHFLEDELLERPSYDDWRRRPEFCNFIYDNDGPAVRKEFFRVLSSRRRVLAPGRVCCNASPIPGGRWIVDWRARKLAYQRDFRFTIAFESMRRNGYTSEKAADALVAGTIPIYWGNSAVDRDIDPSAMIVADDFSSLDELADYVCSVDDEESLARNHVQPNFPFARTASDWIPDLVSFFNRVREFDEHTARRGSQLRRAAALTARELRRRGAARDCRCDLATSRARVYGLDVKCGWVPSGAAGVPHEACSLRLQELLQGRATTRWTQVDLAVRIRPSGLPGVASRRAVKMRVHVTAVGEGARSKQSVQRFRALAENDVVGLHFLVEDPEDADVVLVCDLHATEQDVFPTSLRRSRLPRSWRSKVRVWDQRDNGYYTYPGLYVAPAPRLVKKRRQKAAPYISTIAPVVESTTVPDLLYSFIGTLTYPARAEIFRISHPRALVEEMRGINFFTQSDSGAADRRVAHERYAELIGRSKFVLCPRGLGPSTFRLYETMRAGRVPVIISDQWVPPERIPWSSCSVRVAERSIRGLPTILEANESRWPDLVAGVETVVSTFLAPSVLWNYLVDCLAGIDPGFSARPWFADRRVIRHCVATMSSAGKLPLTYQRPNRA